MKNFSKLYSAELDGIDARLIEVETDVNVGLHSFTIVGLADKAVSEAKERVNSAIHNIGAKAPNRENRKIVVNLAPADVKKAGSHYDLAIALGYLAATAQVGMFNAKNKLFIGELSLEGNLRAIGGVLNMVRAAEREGIAEVFVPAANAREAAIVCGVAVYPVGTLRELALHLEGRAAIAPQPKTEIVEAASHAADISEIKGQANAKRALAVAAAGGHNMFMVGSPGGGKTMLAECLATILPPLTTDEALEVTQVYSAAGLLAGEPYIASRPFRSPHHTASPVAVIGGGANPRPGEISLAHRGVLLLDEIPEFRRDLLEALRQPLESGKAHIARAQGSAVFPAKFMLVAAMNPCPCGYYRDEEKACTCAAHEVLRYQKKVSGPLLDRIDIQIHVPRVKSDELRAKGAAGETSADIRARVIAARSIQAERFAGLPKKGKHKVLTNADMSSKQCEEFIQFTDAAEKFLDTSLKSAAFSARAYYRVLKVAQTIADLEASEKVTDAHLAEAFGYRLRSEEM
ncbi:MAG: YifB family Mg chelatase-like AAA ATPase [Candidatus Harrisonbacteria bacterium]|nr:YifB family Mg chelatase-like AAA ATPase [Candidatus Harrisonbacteria bacterium]